MDFFKFCTLDELKKKGKVTKTILGKKIAVFLNKDGHFFATEILCKHQGSDLTLGKRDGDVYTCVRHGWKYNIKTGECLNQPSPKLKKFKTKLEGEYIRVSLTPLNF